MEVPEELKPGITAPSGKPTLGFYPQETESACGTGVCTPCSQAALFTAAQGPGSGVGGGREDRA